MSEWPATFAGLTPQEARRLDAACERFAKAWEVAVAQGHAGFAAFTRVKSFE